MNDYYENSSQNLDKFKRKMHRKKQKRLNYIIFTDGSCSVKHKDKLGGWGVYIVEPEQKMYSQGYSNTSIGRMETTAFLVALTKIPKDEFTNVTMHIDSRYVIDSIDKGWAKNWKRKGWKGRKNADLWKQVLEEIEARPKMKLNLRHIHSHQTNLEDEIVFGNAVVDRLASYKNHEIHIEDKEIKL